MSVSNSDIIEIFDQLADMLEIKGENPFRIRAYRTAARTISSLSFDISEMVAQNNDLSKLPGIGKDLAEKIKTINETGTLEVLEDLKREIPSELTLLMQVPGIGAKRVGHLYKELNIRNFADLKSAAEKQQIRSLPGFGSKMELTILDQLKRLEQYETDRIPIFQAEQRAEPLLKYLMANKKINKLTTAGSFRRRCESIRDLDILACGENVSEIMDYFTGYDQVRKVVSKGQTKSTILLNNALQVDLRLVPEDSYGAALLYFTGSKAHNIAVRKIAVKRKLKMNEYGLFDGEKSIAGKTEQQVYEAIDLPWIPPELREDRGEIEAAQNGQLPNLITAEDIKGDLHMHTLDSDGRNSLEQMVAAAVKKGYEYIGLTDHSQAVAIANGMSPDRLLEQIEKVKEFNRKQKKITVLMGAEVDILEDGSLDFSDEILEKLDFTVCSVHSKFSLPRKQQTRRILKAMENPHFNILGHPTGRRMGDRPPYDLDMEQVIEAAKENNCVLELNSTPVRLDMNDVNCKAAKDNGVLISISTDSHFTSDLEYIRFGVDQARRGWIERGDVINTRSLKQLKKIFKKTEIINV